VKASFSTKQFLHILSFRRQVYINQESVSKVPNSITLTVKSTTFRIILTDDTVTCFQCHQTGHFSNQSENIPDQVNVINKIEIDMENSDSSPASNAE